jgi:hypothetical protein
MEPTIATGTPATTGAVHFLNIEYFFYLLYELISGTHGAAVSGGAPAFNFSWIVSLITLLWITITIVAYLVSLGFLALLVYSTMRMHQIEDETAPRFATVHDTHEAEAVTEHHRWTHVRELIESPQESDWRQAIIEADIILDDLLVRLGYPGTTTGERLRAVDPARFRTINEAWDAHKVRNELAHQGSAFLLTDHLAYRTILHYENVFKEHGEI